MPPVTAIWTCPAFKNRSRSASKSSGASVMFAVSRSCPSLYNRNSTEIRKDEVIKVFDKACVLLLWRVL